MSQTEPEQEPAEEPAVTVEEEPTYGFHQTVLQQTPEGQLVCTVCGKDVVSLPPEWLEHNTDPGGGA